MGARSEASEQHSVKFRNVELALVKAKTQAIRVADLEKSIAALRAERDKSLADLRTEFEASRKEASQGAVEAARSTGVAQALQAQLAELMKAIQPKPEKLSGVLTWLQHRQHRQQKLQGGRRESLKPSSRARAGAVGVGVPLRQTAETADLCAPVGMGFGGLNGQNLGPEGD